MAVPPRSPSPRAALTRDTFFEGARVIKDQLVPHKKLLITLSVLGLLDATAQAFVPLISGKVFDAVIAIAQNNLAPLVGVFTLIGIWLALQLTDNVVSWRTGFSNDKLSTTLGAEYTAKGFAKVLEMPLSFHTTQKQGDVNDRITRAGNWIDNIVGNVLLTLLPNFLSIIVALIITFVINWRLTLVLVIAIVIYTFILWGAIPRLAALQKKMNRAYNQAGGNVFDIMGNIREIKQAATEEKEKKQIYKDFVQRAAKFWIDMDNVSQGLSFAQKIVVTCTQLSIFIISIFFVREGIITPGELVAFNGYAAMILGPFVALGQQWQMVQNGLVSIVRAEKILSYPTEVYTPKNAIVPQKLAGGVIFDDVHFSYKGGREILRGASFAVRPGEKVALVGESGMGKTTIIDLLSGFYFPNKGKILVDGTDIRKMDLRAYRSKIGIVPQEPTLFNDTIEANLRYGNKQKTREQMIDAAREAHAENFIEGFPKKYKQIVGWRGVKLSIGQKQRIALARAFLRNPDILVLDEPTSALDARSEHLIKESLRKLMEGRTTFIIAHRLSTVREADKILVIQDGVIKEQGNHRELIAIPGGAYRTLYELQTGFTG
jgi:ABC-type multidrug transport system fused ATPase/permease subunit